MPNPAELRLPTHFLSTETEAAKWLAQRQEEMKRNQVPGAGVFTFAQRDDVIVLPANAGIVYLPVPRQFLLPSDQDFFDPETVEAFLKRQSARLALEMKGAKLSVDHPDVFLPQYPKVGTIEMSGRRIFSVDYSSLRPGNNSWIASATSILRGIKSR